MVNCIYTILIICYSKFKLFSITSNATYSENIVTKHSALDHEVTNYIATHLTRDSNSFFLFSHRNVSKGTWTLNFWLDKKKKKLLTSQ